MLLAKLSRGEASPKANGDAKAGAAGVPAKVHGLYRGHIGSSSKGALTMAQMSQGGEGLLGVLGLNGVRPGSFGEALEMSLKVLVGSLGLRVRSLMISAIDMVVTTRILLCTPHAAAHESPSIQPAAAEEH